MLRAYHKKTDQKGFTLIVIAIIGTPAAIAVPQFQTYRPRGFSAAANLAMRNAYTTHVEDVGFIPHLLLKFTYH
jgi:type IV pilus assembly protein PilA